MTEKLTIKVGLKNIQKNYNKFKLKNFKKKDALALAGGGGHKNHGNYNHAPHQHQNYHSQPQSKIFVVSCKIILIFKILFYLY